MMRRTANRGRVVAAATLTAAAGGYALLQWLGRTAGTTPAERAARLPGDDLIERPLVTTTHAGTIGVTPDRVWPWLVQMGWHQGGWYTARWVDRMLFPANWPSADRIIPDLQGRRVGDRIPDGAPQTRTEFVIVAMERDRHLVLRSRTHVPLSWRERYGAWIDWTWAFVLEPVADGTRLIVRSRCRLGPRWIAAGYWLAIVPADFVMARQQLRGISSRAKRAAGRHADQPADEHADRHSAQDGAAVLAEAVRREALRRQ
jgi:hypothetical protein